MTERQDEDMWPRHIVMFFVSPSYVSLFIVLAFLCAGVYQSGPIGQYIGDEHSRVANTLRNVMLLGILGGYVGAPAALMMVRMIPGLRRDILLNVIVVVALVAQVAYVAILVLMCAYAPFGAAW
jgi:hypothetical protein